MPSLLEEVSLGIEEPFVTLLDLAKDNQQHMRTHDRAAGATAIESEEGKLDAALAAIEDRQEQERVIAEARAKEEKERRERAVARVQANDKIRSLLEGVNDTTYPRLACNTPRLMYELLGKIQALYTNKIGKARSVDFLLRYLRGSVSNVWWLWSEWILACIVEKDYCTAETLLTAAWECHEFAKQAKGLQGKLVAARGMMYLVRDEDFPKALDYMDLARDKHAYEPACIGLFHQLNYAEKKGKQEEAIAAVQPLALITQEWKHDDYRKRLATADTRSTRLLDGGDSDDEEEDERRRYREHD